MSTINVTNLSGRGGATPNLPDGANITGVATATSFDGNLKSTGTPTLGLGVTINSSGVAISGVCTAGIVSATTFYGSGSGLTGVGETIAPWNYNPDVGDTKVSVDVGIGVTFNKKVEAGSGTATLKIVNAGAAGTTIQSWGVSSCTFNITKFTMGSLVSNLLINQTYQLDIPSGFIVDSNETSYAGTAYTFTAQAADQKLFVWGINQRGILGQDTGSANAKKSSPTQIPGVNWGLFQGDGALVGHFFQNVKQDGTLWSWGYNSQGQGGNSTSGPGRSSPTQVGSDDTWRSRGGNDYSTFATKTDGTLWSWGWNGYGQLGQGLQGTPGNISSPEQVGSGTDWSTTVAGAEGAMVAIKTDGTLWVTGRNHQGQLAQNSIISRSSPVQIPGTTWRSISGGNTFMLATKTNGTLWAWGQNQNGMLAQNNVVSYSSPVQIPGTSWASAVECGKWTSLATRTDGTLWAIGFNGAGQSGQNSTAVANYSSPVQIPGTTWGTNQTSLRSGNYFNLAIKTDNTLWGWGEGGDGKLGLNTAIHRSSPTQIPGNWISISTANNSAAAILKDETPGG